jgi:hypothetical protein
LAGGDADADAGALFVFLARGADLTARGAC